MPELTLSLPAIIGLLVVFIAIGGVIVYAVLNVTKQKASAAAGTVTATETVTPTITTTPTETLTPTPANTPTPLPPLDYKINPGDSCVGIAANYHISKQSLIDANTGKINSDCTNLIAGTTIKVPQPTATAAPVTAQSSQAAAVTKATTDPCQTIDYTVQANDTLSSIAANYLVKMDAIKSKNGMLTDQVNEGDTIKIPLCNRTNGPTETPTTPPPYPKANLLLPANGAAYNITNDTVTLQWASVGTLRPNESYAVTVEDLTDASGRKLVEYTTTNSYTVPVTFRPTDATPHIMAWTILTVRQTGQTKDNQPIWTPAGDVSDQRVFSWSGAPQSAATPKP
jgi:LysM repeat protein